MYNSCSGKILLSRNTYVSLKIKKWIEGSKYKDFQPDSNHCFYLAKGYSTASVIYLHIFGWSESDCYRWIVIPQMLYFIRMHSVGNIYMLKTKNNHCPTSLLSKVMFFAIVNIWVSQQICRIHYSVQVWYGMDSMLVLMTIHFCLERLDCM